MMEGLWDVIREPYAVASMEERSRVPRNGLTAVSTFSGCGGSSLGMKTAGFTIPYAVEFIPAARETYQANAPETFVDGRDIREVTAEDVLNRLGIDTFELDLLEGSPPCSSFSGAGIARAGEFGDTRGKVKTYSDGVKQATDDLFLEWLRLVEGLRPRAILAENVPDMLKEGEARRFTFAVQDALRGMGYDVHAQVYSTKHAGGATIRRRLIFMGVRRDVGSVPRPVLTGDGYTLREALGTFPGPIPDDEWMESWQDGTGTNSRTGEPLPRYVVADHWETCLDVRTFHSRDICKLTKNDDGRYPSLLTLGRAKWDEPLPTVTATGRGKGAACIMHPDECRRFTPTELKWLSGFPIDFVLTGTPSQRYERIGRAVTPPLYEALSPYLARALGA